MFYILEMMSRWIAPILSFTAEEIWSHLPGQRDESIFLSTWFDLSGGAYVGGAATQPTMAMDFWAQVIELREVVNKELEKLRVAGGIGSGLDAEVDLWCGRELHTRLSGLGDELRFALITSYARLHDTSNTPADAVHARLSNGDELWVAVRPSEHAKCVRCWHHRHDVGINSAHPELCGRCADNVAGSGEQRRFA